MRRYPRPISAFISSSAQPTGLLEQLDHQRKLLRLVRTLLPTTLDPHCLAVLLKDKKLLLYTDSSAWASRLRFHSRELIQALASRGVSVTKINVRVLIRVERRGPKPRSMRRLSGENAALLRQTAEDLSDPDLSAALARLAKKSR